MSSTFDRLCSDQLITDYPYHMKNNIHYEVIMGSAAYGVSTDMSDIDIYGFCMPPKNILFPYNSGNIFGFGKKPKTFNQYQKHHIKDTIHNKEYDITIYNIVKYFQLCMENNPNMIDSLFVPTRCILHSTTIGNHVQENRELFLSKKSWHTFKGYAFKQLHKMKNKYAKEFVDHCVKYDISIDAPFDVVLEPLKNDEPSLLHMATVISKIETNGKRSKRLSLIRDHGYDTKFGYHVVRLIDECQQILEDGNLDLTRSREHLKAIRKGEWSIDNIISYFDTKLITLENLYKNSDLQYSCDEDKIKNLLLECIEMHYGSVEKMGFKKDTDITDYISDAIISLNKAINQL